jgi:hypothetical protein
MLHRGLPPAAVLLATLAAIALPAEAAAQPDPAPLAAPTVYAGGVDFLPNVSYSSAKITVSGPEMEYERTFAAGEPLSIDLFDPEGQLLADGTYSWRLALTPAEREARELRRAVRQDGGVAPDPWLPVTGTFAIRNGLIVDPSLVEARPARPAVAGDTAALPMELATASSTTTLAEDSDEAVTAGRSVETRGAVDDGAASPAPAGRTILERTDAGAALVAPASPELIEETQPAVRSYPTEGKNGRE